METIVRGAAIYLALLVIMRFSGRRALGEMTSFDFVLMLIVAETAQQALIGDDFSISTAILLMIVLFGADVALSCIKQRWPRVSRWVDGQATVLISRGRVDERALRRSRVNLADVLLAARRQEGLERLDQVRFAVLEVDGSISIVPEPDDGMTRPVSAGTAGHVTG